MRKNTVGLPGLASTTWLQRRSGSPRGTQLCLKMPSPRSRARLRRPRWEGESGSSDSEPSREPSFDGSDPPSPPVDSVKEEANEAPVESSFSFGGGVRFDLRQSERDAVADSAAQLPDAALARIQLAAEEAAIAAEEAEIAAEEAALDAEEAALNEQLAWQAAASEAAIAAAARAAAKAAEADALAAIALSPTTRRRLVGSSAALSGYPTVVPCHTSETARTRREGANGSCALVADEPSSDSFSKSRRRPSASFSSVPAAQAAAPSATSQRWLGWLVGSRQDRDSNPKRGARWHPLGARLLCFILPLITLGAAAVLRQAASQATEYSARAEARALSATTP